MPKPPTETRNGLTPDQLKTLQTRLLTERERLVRNAGEASSPIREPGERESEPMDEAEIAKEQHEAVGLREHDRVLLREIEHALARIADGTYGLSEESGEPIGFERLQAIPWARRTAAEQEALERLNRNV
jgi:DnaK suppressor protein